MRWQVIENGDNTIPYCNKKSQARAWDFLLLGIL